MRNPGWGWRVGGRGLEGPLNPSSPLQLDQLHVNLHLVLSDEKPHDWKECENLRLSYE